MRGACPVFLSARKCARCEPRERERERESEARPARGAHHRKSARGGANDRATARASAIFGARRRKKSRACKKKCTPRNFFMRVMRGARDDKTTQREMCKKHYIYRLKMHSRNMLAARGARQLRTLLPKKTGARSARAPFFPLTNLRFTSKCIHQSFLFYPIERG
jgi:hypothetical protein